MFTSLYLLLLTITVVVGKAQMNPPVSEIDEDVKAKISEVINALTPDARVIGEQLKEEMLKEKQTPIERHNNIDLIMSGVTDETVRQQLKTAQEKIIGLLKHRNTL